MAHVSIDADLLHVQLEKAEQLGALHGGLDIPLEHVASARTVADLWSELKGLRAPGTGIPGVIMLGTTRYDGKKDFCAVYKHRPGIVIELRDEAFARVLVSLPETDAQAIATQLNGASGV